MSRNLTLALLAGASLFSIGVCPAAAGDPNVIYANDPQATAVHSNMGGGFIQFLFGDGPQSQRYYEREPMYQQQPSYYVPQGAPMPGQVLQVDWLELPTRPRIAGRERRVYALLGSLPFSGAQSAYFSFDMTAAERFK